MKKEQRTMLQGGVTYEKEDPERKIYIANLMYKYPENIETIELIPTETIVYNNSFGRTNEIVEQGRLRDIREEQEIRAREARLQRRNTSEKPARQRIDYINKVGNVKDFGVPQVNENIVMKAKIKKIQTPSKDYNEIASLMYPTMEEKSQIQVKKKEPVLLGETSIWKEPDMITLADKEYVVKPLDGTFTGAAASVYSSKYDEAKNKKYINNLKLMADTEADKKFLNILEYILGLEKGYNNVKGDVPTNLGITQFSYNNYRKRHGLPYKDVKNITIKEAIPIYYKDFWKPSMTEDLAYPLALVYFDMYINGNPSSAKKILKKSNKDVYELLDLRKKYYDDVILRNPKKERFRKGWYNRLKQLREYIENLEKYKNIDYNSL